MKRQEDNPVNQYIRFSGIAIQMGTIICAGIYLGVWLDNKYPNDFSGFTVICSLLSVFLSLFAVIKQVQNITTKSNTNKK